MDPMVECIVIVVQLPSYKLVDIPLMIVLWMTNVTLEVGTFFIFILIYIITFQLSHEN